MSHWVRMVCPCCDAVLEVEPHEEGGTYVVGGTSEARLNVTYNYSRYYYVHLSKEGGLRWLYDKPGATVAGQIKAAIDAILADTALEAKKLEGFWGPDDYWKPTRENAVAPLRRFLAWAERHPDGIFKGD